MGNRFGLKDLLQIVLLIALIVTVWLSMKQREREWKLLQTIQEQGTEQTRDLSSIRRAVQNPRFTFASRSTTGPTGVPTTGQAQEPGDPFKYIEQAQQNPDYAPGDWLVDNFGTKVPKLTPLISSDVYQAIVEARVTEGLAYQDPNTLEYLPLLATSWQLKDNSEQWEQYVKPLRDKGMDKDALSKALAGDAKAPIPVEITFQLRQGVTFSDGTPFTADDVVFTFNWIMNPRVQAPRQRAYYEKIASVEKKGDSEVVFKFREPYFEAFDLASGMSVMAKHFYGSYTPEQFNENPGLLLGTGPYRLPNPSGWRPGDQIALVRNERYWGEPGPFNKLVYPQVQTDAASMTMFQNGETDIFGATPEQYKLLLNDKPLVKRTQHFEVASPLSGYAYIAWNQKRAGEPTRFADRNVRLAMTMLTDRQRICDDVLLGYASIADGPFSPLGKPQTSPRVHPWPFDPSAAKNLLGKAGFLDRNGDGVLEDPQGRPFEFKLTYPANSETYERIVLFLKDNYAKAGIKMEPDPVDWPLLIKKLDSRDFDAISLRWSGGAETDIYQMFHSDQIKDGGDNVMSYSNPKLDAAIDLARATVSESKRMPLWQEASWILHEDQPYTFLFRSKVLEFIDGRIRNVHKSKLGLNYIGRLNMPCPWYVPKPLQKWGK